MLCTNSAYSFTNQTDEYSCANFASLNLINEACKTCQTPSVNYIKKLQHTNKKGTTTYNLCKGLEKYFIKERINPQINYYGIKSVKYYKQDNSIDFSDIKKQLNNGYYAILNLGVYTKDNNGNYIRQYGHYINLIAIADDKLKIFDPYDKNSDESYWQISSIDKIKLININDNEKYCNSNKYYIITSAINYLKSNEIAIINGIITVKLTPQ